VQYVARDTGEIGPGAGHQPRTFWGRIAHGTVRAGDLIQIFPSGETATIGQVRHAGDVVDACEAGQSAGIVLDRQLDVSRGDWIVTPASVEPAQRFAATLAWLDTVPAIVGRKYWVRHGHRWVQARITGIESRLDIHNLRDTEAHELALNEIGRVQIETQAPLPLEAYRDNRVGGSLIVVDPTSNRTSGALMVQALQ
jgi:sulfate adenylyltransferase subunit 1